MTDTRIAISVYKPLVQTASLEQLYTNLGSKVSSYSHEISAYGGYDKGSAVFFSDLIEGNDWYINGLGRHVVTYSPTGKQIWAGFVNKVDVVYGTVSRTAGPLLDIANKVKAKYTLIDTDTTIPLHGVEAEIAYVENSDSQDKYGVFEVTLNLGEVSATEADQTINSYLAQHAWPQKTRRVSLSRGAEPRVSLEILGYYHWLFYLYNNTSGTSDVNLSAKISDILTADPNSIISSDHSNIATNTTQVPDYEDMNRTADALIKSLVMASDGSYNRYVFGVYDDQVPIYETIPDTNPPQYLHNPSDLQGKIYDVDETEVMPWDVLPGKWLYLTGFDIGRAFHNTTDVFTDDMLNYLFIEKVRYSIPNSITIDSGKVIGFDQRLSRSKSLSGAQV